MPYHTPGLRTWIIGGMLCVLLLGGISKQLFNGPQITTVSAAPQIERQNGTFRADSQPQGERVMLAIDSAEVADTIAGTMPLTLTVDDGTMEQSIGDGGQFVWFNRFTPDASSFPLQLEEVWVMFGATLVPTDGAIEIVIHEDTDGDGNPGTGAVLVESYITTVQTTTSGIWSMYSLPEPIVFNTPGDILIGVVNRYGSEGVEDFPAGIDQGLSQQRSWAASYQGGNVPNTVEYPADEQWGTIDSFGLPGNWMIRGFGTTIEVTPTPTETPTATITPTVTETPTATITPTATQTPAEWSSFIPWLSK